MASAQQQEVVWKRSGCVPIVLEFSTVIIHKAKSWQILTNLEGARHPLKG